MLNGQFASIKVTMIEVTMIEAKLNDGQSMLVFNDLFVGSSSHVSPK